MRSWSSTITLLVATCWPAALRAQVIMSGPPRRDSSQRHRTLLPAITPANLNAIVTAAVPASQGENHLFGRALGPDGPVANAMVTVCQRDPSVPFYAPVLFEHLRGPCQSCTSANPMACGCGSDAEELEKAMAERRNEPRPVARGKTRADGGFDIGGLAGGQYEIWIDAPALAPALIRDAKTTTRVWGPAHLTAGRMRTGRVVNEADEPVPQAVVTLVDFRGGRLFDGLTDADGSFSIGPVDTDTDTVIVRRAGFLAADATLRTKDGSQPVIRLVDPRRFEGTVKQDGEAAAGVRVHAHSLRCRQTAVSDDAGRFVLENLWPGTLILDASKGTAWGTSHVSITLSDESTAGTISLLRGGGLEGSVLDDAGDPSSGATVVAELPGVHQVSGRTDSKGRFHLEGLLEGDYAVSAHQDGFQDAGRRWVAVRESGTQETSFRLERGLSLQGSVVDGQGRPARAWLRLHSLTPSVDAAFNTGSGVHEREAEAGSDGHFLITGLSPGPWELTAGWGAGDDTPSRRLRLPSSPVRIVVGPTGAVTGKLLDSKGRPVKGVYVQAEVPPADGTSDYWESDGQGDQTKSDGTFRLRGVRSGRHRVEANEARDAARRKEWRTARTEVSVRSGAIASVNLVLGDWKPADLSPPPKFRRLRGKVLDVNGSPIADIKLGEMPVHCTNSGEFDTTISSAQIGFRGRKFPLVPVVYVSAAGLPARSIALPEGDGDFDLGTVVLSASRPHFRLRVLSPDGTPLSGAIVAAETAPYACGIDLGWGTPVTSDSKGFFEVPNLPSAETVVFVQHPGFPLAKVSVPANTDAIDVRLVPGVPAQGHLKDRKGRPIQGARLCIEGPGGSYSVQTTSDGSFHLDGAGAGTYSVDVDLDIWTRTTLGVPREVKPKPVAIEGPGAAIIDLTWP